MSDWRAGPSNAPAAAVRAVSERMITGSAIPFHVTSASPRADAIITLWVMNMMRRRLYVSAITPPKREKITIGITLTSPMSPSTTAELVRW
jgi:hypothetical protein